MLNPYPSREPAFRQSHFGSSNAESHDAVAVERMRRQEEAEQLACIGLSEIVVNLDGENERQHWSAGIYALLRRDRTAPPLQRRAYVLQYVQPEDQQRVLDLSLNAMERGHTVDMTYRIVRDDGCLSNVCERLAVVRITPTERLLFADLRQIPQHERVTIASEHTQKSTQGTLPATDTGVPAMQELLATFDALREREQRRLAREMHDDFGQLLAAMKLDLYMLNKKLTQGDPSGLQQVENLQELVDSMITSTRRIIADLPPKAVEELGLFAALEQLIAGFRKRHPAQVTIRLVPPTNRLDPAVELAAYRVLQETLNNIARHAAATAIDIDAGCSATHLRLRVRDNGKGMAAAELGKSGSFGLLWMRERVLALSGTFDLDSVDGQGTSITISLPLVDAQHVRGR